MIRHPDLKDKDIRGMIRAGTITFAGNLNLKIYGRLSCAHGKRMKKVNRVFFQREEAAIANGFRPCGHCMTESYRKWKALLRSQVL